MLLITYFFFILLIKKTSLDLQTFVSNKSKPSTPLLFLLKTNLFI